MAKKSKFSASGIRKLGQGTMTASVQKTIVESTRDYLDTNTRLSEAKVNAVIDAITQVLPQLGSIKNGIVKIGVGATLGIETCTGGHLCDGQDGGAGSCGVESCSVQICSDHGCDTQACGTQACDGNSCGSNQSLYENLVINDNRFRSAWELVQRELLTAVNAKQLQVHVNYFRG